MRVRKRRTVCKVPNARQGRRHQMLFYRLRNPERVYKQVPWLHWHRSRLLERKMLFVYCKVKHLFTLEMVASIRKGFSVQHRMRCRKIREISSYTILLAYNKLTNIQRL